MDEDAREADTGALVTGGARRLQASRAIREREMTQTSIQERPRVSGRTRKRVSWLLRRAEGALLPAPVREAEGAHLAPAEARASLVASAEDVALSGHTVQAAALIHALDSTDPAVQRAYIDKHGVAGVRFFHAGEQTRIYCLDVETFPLHVNNVYVVLEPGSSVMIDCGSGTESSTRDLALGFAVVRAVFGEDVRYEQLDWCVITHAHIDHFGGANRLRESSRARLAVHELDARVLACFEERLVIASKDVDIFWRRAGVPDDSRARMLDAYGATKRFFRSVDIDRALRDGDVFGPGYRVHHTPGHCPGQICLQAHDALFTSDHVLARTTPHQFPQAITPFGGLEHYFHSLAKVRRLDGINVALAGHEEPIWDLRARVDAIALFHRERLAKVMALCKEPRTILDVSEGMFGEVFAGDEAKGGLRYGTLLAIEEAGAHVEYLHQLGKLRIANLGEVERERDPVIRYVARA
jgi:glyoxylase-like metal-dependent hydrolase (beta-lactamase superfamily II)